MSKEENFKLFCELRGKKVEYSNYLGNWVEGDLVSWHEDHDACFGIGDSIGEIVSSEIRPIKKPEYKPWDASSIPFPLAVRKKCWDKSNLAIVTNIYHDSISYRHQGLNINESFEDLLEFYETRDGQPCGMEVEG